MLGLACEWTPGKVDGAERMRRGIEVRREDGAKQAKVEKGEGMEGMKRGLRKEGGDGIGARNKSLDNYGPAAKERNRPQATGPRVTARAASPLPGEAGEGDPEGGGMLGEGAGGD